MPNFTILAPNGKKYKVSGPNREGAIEALNNKLNPKKDSSLGTALEFGKLNTYANTNDYVADLSEQFNNSGFANTLYNARNKIRGFFGAEPIDDATRDAATVAEQRKKVAELQKQRDALDYESLTSDSITGFGSGAKYALQKVAESADGIAAALATGGTITPFLGAGEVNASLKEIESLDPEKRVKLATGGGLVIAALENLGLGYLFKGLVPEVVGAMGVKKINSILTAKGLAQLPVKVVAAMSTEGVTEGLQEGVVIGADALGGKEFKDNEIIERLKEASIAGAAAGGTIRTGTASIEGFGPQPFDDTEQNRAATAFARRIKKIAEDNNHNLNDVGVKSTNGAREVVTKAHTQMAEELRVLFSDLKPLVAVNDQDTLVDLEDKILAEAGRKEGKNLAKSQVGAQELNALDRLAGEFYEGQQARNLLLEMNELTALHKSGYKGGVSKVTDLANPLNNLTHPFSSQGGLTGLATTGAAYMAGGGTGLAIQGGAFAGGRAIDAVTGRRSTVNKYIKDNTKSDRMTQLSPIGPSLREDRISQAEQQKMEEVALNRSLDDMNAPPKGDPNDQNPAPQYVMENSTGLSKVGVAEALAKIEADGVTPIVQRAIDSYRKSVRESGTVTNLTQLIRLVKAKTISDPLVQAQVINKPQPILGETNTTNAKLDAEPQFGPRFTTQENYNRGIEANKKFNADQKTALNEVNNEGIMSESDYKTLSQAIDELDGNLGSKPLETFEAVYKKLENVDPKLVQEIIDPMYERITKQQRQRTVTTREGKTKEARVAPVPFGNAKMQSIFNVNNPAEGGNYIDLDSKQDLTGNTYQGGSIKIVNGKPMLETSDVQVDPGTKQDGGVKIKTNLFKQKAGWKWVDYDGPETIVSTEARGKHHYSLSNSFDVPVTLQTYPKQTSEPRLRPTSQGEVKLGEQIGTILVRGNPHPVYDEVRVVSGNNEAKVKDQKVMQPIQFGSTTDVALDTNLNNSFTMARDKVYNKGRDFKLDLQAKSLEAQEREGIDLSTLDDANIDRLADFAFTDALEALKDNQNAIGWYGRTVDQALKTVAEIHPEVLTDPKAKMQFIWATAVTSNGLKVDKNFELALDVYETLKETGRFPTDAGIGQAAKGINFGLGQYHTMLDKFNRLSNSEDGAHAFLADFMDSKFPLKQLEKEYGVKISGEGKDTLIRGAAILGPKIGGGFYSNLYGKFDELTMDRWLMRTVGRWRGGLVNINKPMIKKKTTEIKGMMKSYDLKPFKPLFIKAPIKPTKNMSKSKVEQLSEAIAKLSMDPEWRKQINAIPGGPELRKAGNALAKYLDGQVEAPAGPKERNFIRAVFAQTLDRLNNSPELKEISNEPITMSDLQALLWYPEKRLYDTAKQKDGESRGYKDDEAPDYANAARKAVANRLERSGQGNRLGSSGRTGSPGGGPAPADAGLPGATRQGILGQFFGGQRNAAPKNNDRSQPVSEAEIRAQIPVVQAVFEIDKKGSEYENGIRDFDAILNVAKAYSIIPKLYRSFKDMEKADPTITEGALGAYNPNNRQAMAIMPGGVDAFGGTVSGLASFSYMVHEVAHGIAGSDINTNQFMGDKFVFNYLTNQDDTAGINSLEAVFGDLVNTPNDARSQNKIIAEMLAVQKNLTFKDPDTGQVLPLRQTKSLMDSYNAGQRRAKANGVRSEQFNKDVKAFEKQIIDQRNYEQSIPELTVNALQVAMMHPKIMKKVAPNTYKLLKHLFDNSKNKSGIKFFNHSLAMAVAVILAMMARGEEPPEEQQQPMPPGALTPAPGILAA